MTNRLGLLALLLLPATLLACGVDDSDPAGGGDEPAAERERVIAAAREVAGRLEDVGEISRFSGQWRVCGSPPEEAVEYAASGRLAGNGDQTATIDAAADALTGDGWSVTDEGTDPHRWVNLERDGVTASLRPDPLKGSDAVAWALAGDCVSIGDGETNDFSFDREPLE